MANIDMTIGAARVFVWDLDAAKRFYAEALGLSMKADGSAHGYCVFRAAIDLVVEAVAPDAPAEERALVGRFTGLSFAVADAQAAYEALAAVGVAFSGPPERQAWGGVLATFSDPSGNELQIVQAPVA
ncbi:MAG: VOC family protein [Proteobacteria bacterium]|nr:VOC family protein [Pseudomonadota bacterium]